MVIKVFDVLLKLLLLLIAWVFVAFVDLGFCPDYLAGPYALEGCHKLPLFLLWPIGPITLVLAIVIVFQSFKRERLLTIIKNILLISMESLFLTGVIVWLIFNIEKLTAQDMPFFLLIAMPVLIWMGMFLNKIGVNSRKPS